MLAVEILFGYQWHHVVTIPNEYSWTSMPSNTTCILCVTCAAFVCVICVAYMYKCCFHMYMYNMCTYICVLMYCLNMCCYYVCNTCCLHMWLCCLHMYICKMWCLHMCINNLKKQCSIDNKMRSSANLLTAVVLRAGLVMI